MNRTRLAALSAEDYATWFAQHRQVLPQRSPFHDPAWLAAAGKGARCETVFIGVYEGRELVAAVPGFLTRRGPLRLFGSPLRGTMTSYLGPVGLLSEGGAAQPAQLIEAYSRFARRHWGARYTEFTLREPPVDARRLLGDGWDCTPRGSYCLDLTRGVDALWAGMKGRGRRNIRKAERLGVSVVPLRDVDLYYRMHADTFARRGTVPTFSRAFYRIILEGLVPRGLVRAWGVEHDGEVVAAGLFLQDDREMHYLSGASLTRYRAIPTSYLLHWHAIVAAVRSGLQVYDLVGRGIAGIDQFKEAFEPEPIDYWSVNWSPGHVRFARRAFLAALPRLRRVQRVLRRERRDDKPARQEGDNT